jgi:hypothetical protein
MVDRVARATLPKASLGILTVIYYNLYYHTFSLDCLNKALKLLNYLGYIVVLSLVSRKSRNLQPNN